MDDIASIIAQQGDLARRRKLLEVMQGQNIQTGITGGDRGSSIGQALAKIATAYLLHKRGGQLAQEEASNRQAYGAGLQSALANHLTMRDGAPGQTFSTEEARNLMENDIAPGPKAEPVKADPRRAAISAMASQFPELQAIGRTEYGGLQKEQINPLDLLKLEGFDPKSKVLAALGGGVGSLEGKREYRDANGQIFAIGPDGTPQRVADARDKFGPTKLVNGEAVQFAEGTGKAHQVATRPPQTNVNVIPPAQKVGLEELAKKYAQNVAEMGQAAQSAQRLSGALAQMGKLSEAGTFEGPLADPAIFLNRLAANAGVPVDRNKLANSETYASTASEAVQRLVGQFGGNRGVTKEEAAVIAQIVPQLQSSVQARAQMTQILQSVAQRQMEGYQKAHQNYIRFVQTQDPSQIDPTLYGSQMPFDQPVAPQPGAGQPGGGGVMELSDYLRSRKGG